MFVLVLLMASCAEPEPKKPVVVDTPEPIVEVDYGPPLFAYKSDTLYGFINIDGEITIPATFNEVGEFTEGLAPVRVGLFWGYIDKSGKYFVEPNYQIARGFYEGKAAVAVGGKMGYIDKTKQMVIDPKFDGAWSFNNGRALVLVDGLVGFINAEGEEIVPATFFEALPYSENYAVAFDTFEKKYGYIDTSGFWAVHADFEELWPYSENVAAVARNGKWGYIDKKGLYVIAPEYDYAWGFSDGLGLVKQHGFWSFIDHKGERAFPDTFLDAWEFSEGLAPVITQGLWGFIDKKGAVQIAPKYTGYSKFENGLALMQIDDSVFYINKYAEVVTPHDAPPRDTTVVEETDTTSTAPEVDTTTMIAAVEEPVVQPQNNVPAGSPQAAAHKDAWTNRRGGLARHVVTFILDECKENGFIVLLGKSNSAYYTVEGSFKNDAGYMIADFVVRDIDGTETRKPLVAPETQYATTHKDTIRDKMLRNLWYWASAGLLDRRKIRDFKYTTGAQAGSSDYYLKVPRPNGNMYYWQFTSTGWRRWEVEK